MSSRLDMTLCDEMLGHRSVNFVRDMFDGGVGEGDSSTLGLSSPCYHLDSRLGVCDDRRKTLSTLDLVG